MMSELKQITGADGCSAKCAQDVLTAVLNDARLNTPKAAKSNEHSGTH